MKKCLQGLISLLKQNITFAPIFFNGANNSGANTILKMRFLTANVPPTVFVFVMFVSRPMIEAFILKEASTVLVTKC